MKPLAGAKALLADFLDRNARASTASPRAESIKAALGAAVAIASGVTEAAKLAFGPSVAPLFVVISPGVFLVASLFIVASKDEESATLLDVRGMQGPASVRYRYPQLLRSAAKLLAPVLALQVLFNLYGLLPNGLAHRTVLAGTICGEAAGVASAHVSAVDKFGNFVSQREETSDDRGFVVLDLQARALAPALVRIRSPGCGGSQDIEIGESTTATCGAPGTATASAHLWRLSCKG